MLFQPNLLLLVLVTQRLLIPEFELLGLLFPGLTLTSPCDILRSPFPTKYFVWIAENMKSSCWLRWSKYKRAQWGWEGQHWGGLRSCTTPRMFVCQDFDVKRGICPWLSSQINAGKYPSSKAAKPGKNCSWNVFQKRCHSTIRINSQSDLFVSNYSSLQQFVRDSAEPI